MPQLSNPMRLTLLSALAGIALIGALTLFFRRRKRRKVSLYRDIYIETKLSGQPNSVESDSLRRHPGKMMESNGDIPNLSYNSSPGVMRRSCSSVSMKSDANSTSTVTALSAVRSANVTPGHLLELGMELVHKAKSRWELALQQIDEMDSVDEDGCILRAQLQQLIDLTTKMQDGSKGEYLNQICTSAALDAALDEMDREFEQQRRKNKYIYEESSSDLDSFVSALDMADLSDLEDQRETFQHLALYEAALLELTYGSVPCRYLRTKMVNCLSDTEFLTKLHCIRLAFLHIFSDEVNREWFISLGRQLFTSLLENADRDPDEFQMAYDALIMHVKNNEKWSEMEDELKGRGVKMMSFYDIVIDFLIFDAFDDLENPPASVTAIMQNRWLTSGFKETALSTAVWSVLKAKRTMLKFPKGFIAQFYSVSETTSPVLAWGFLGPDGPLKDMCNFFKNQILGFMWDVFSFDKARYTTVEELAEDILQLAKERAVITSDRLSPQSIFR